VTPIPGRPQNLNLHAALVTQSTVRVNSSVFNRSRMPHVCVAELAEALEVRVPDDGRSGLLSFVDNVGEAEEGVALVVIILEVWVEEREVSCERKKKKGEKGGVANLG
jgi:hypothetical protein